MHSLKIMKMHDPTSFYQTLRFHPEDFDKLLHLIAPSITHYCPSRESINPATRLAVTLRYLATGQSVRSLALDYVLGETTVRDAVEEALDAIYLILQPIVLPEPDEEMLRSIAEGFWQRWDFPHCVGSVDGRHIPIRKSRGAGSEFYCYKNFHSVVLMAMCDYRYRFVVVDSGAEGRQSDGGIFANSLIGKRLESKQYCLPPSEHVPFGPKLPYFLLGDEAFGLSEYMMTPYTGRSTGKLDYEKQIYNYRHSRARRIIENSFGILVQTWRILGSKIEANVEVVDKIVLAAVCLHNYRLIENENVKPHQKKYLPPRTTDIDINLDSINQQQVHHTLARAAKVRSELTDFFMNGGETSWQHAMV